MSVAAERTHPMERYGELVKRLVTAYTRGDEADFMQGLDDIVHSRRRELFSELRKLTEDVRRALERFQLDARFTDLAEKEVPDARQRLAHVMHMTDDAAHKTMDLVEASGPFAERIGRGAAELQVAMAAGEDVQQRLDQYLSATHTDAERIRRNLSEVLLAQGYQDLTGQIIRGVITLVTEVETALASLVHLANGERALLPRKPSAEPTDGYSRGHGPAVPGVNNGPAVGGQQDVDDLLSDLGI